MSTRWYPLFQLGNPQRRVFLPNFWMKLIRGAERDIPGRELPNSVKFIVSMDMTRHDVKNYLKHIYNVDALGVNIEVRRGPTKEVATATGKMVVKEDDFKVAYIRLAEKDSFVFPDIYPVDKAESKDKEDKKHIDQVRQLQEKMKASAETKPDLPGWFT